MTVADTIWVAAKLLERERPDVRGFSKDEIEQKVRQIDPSLRAATVSMHLSAHCLAWKPARPSALRTLSQNPDGSLRLFREGDPYHPDRTRGRTTPKLSALPDEYRNLLEDHGAQGEGESRKADSTEDPILALTGVGREMFARLGGGEEFIRALREEVFPPFVIEATSAGRAQQTISLTAEEVWQRVRALQGRQFRTIEDKPFFYEVRGNGIVPHPRMGEATNRVLPRRDLEKAWKRMPVSGPGELRDLQGPTYLFGILSDPRVKGA